MLASGCAVARAFPLYSRKTPGPSPQTVTVGFIVVGDEAAPLNDDDVKCLTAECEGEWVWSSGCGLRPSSSPRDSYGSRDSGRSH